jgi:hypothetical protein
MFNLYEQELYDILSNPKWYSYSKNGIKNWMNIDCEKLAHVAYTLSQKLGDKVNYFTYNDVVYLGLETRRLAYEVDKKAGTNRIEKLIHLGYYN